MSINDFVIKWQGRFLDYDGVYPNQCFDLFHQYVVEVLGLSDGRILAAPAARDIYNNFNNLYGHEYFERIGNTPEGVPNEGDIVIWGYNPYGHVAIFIEGNANTFRSFDQNSPIGSPCHIQNHTYSSVLGWLRFRPETIPDNQALTECLKQHTELVAQLDQIKKQLQQAQQLNQEIENELESLKSQIQHYQGFEKQLAITLNPTSGNIDEANLLGEISKLINIQDQFNKANNTIKEFQLQVTVLTQKSSEFEEKYKTSELTNSQQADMINSLNQEIANLNRKLEQAQNIYTPIFEIFGLTICTKKAL
jgi:archaellum component FlaC